MKIYKDRKNAKVCGVCAGLADYLNLDVTLVRVVWALLALMGSFGFWAYLICAVVFPNKEEVL